MDTFEDLKIAPALVAGTEAMGWDAPSAIQGDAVPVVRRGNNVVLHASAGSGVGGAYGLGILDRLAGADQEPGDPWALVLVPDARAASRTAASLARLAGPAGLRVRSLTAGSPGPTHVLVAPVDAAMSAVRTSDLKLERVAALVVDGADLLADVQWEPLESLVDSVPGAAQRVLVTGRLDSAMDRFIERHVRKAMTIPPRAEARKPDEGATAVRYAVATQAQKTDGVVRLLAEATADQVAVVCRTRDDVDELARDLAGRGLMDSDAPPQVLVLPRGEADRRSIQAMVISRDPPFDADELEALHANGGVILVTPREKAHLLLTAGRAGIRLEAVSLETPDLGPAAALRDRLRDAARGDLAPEMALLEPLLDELPAVELAAAAIRLARPEITSSTVEAAQPGRQPATPVPSGAAPPPDAGTWVHLFMSIGHRDEVGPGDIVGAITGEAGVSGDRVGKIDIRESHTTVEVATEVAGEVIRALNGRSLRGRSLRVDYDRKGTGRERDRDGGSKSGRGRRPGRRPR